MKRTIYPVGHGAFYVELFENNHAIIYDCGSKSKSVIDSIIKSMFQGLIINCLFISHFHSDHTNGVIELINSISSGSIKKVIIPKINLYITAFNLIHLATNNPLASYDQLRDIIELTENPINFFNERGIENIIQVTNETSNDEEPIDIDSLNSNRNITSNTTLSYKNKWFYIPLNHEIIPIIDLQSILSILGYSMDLFINVDNMKWTEIKNLVSYLLRYKYYNSDMNHNCMALFSGSLSSKRNTRFAGSSSCTHQDGALYIGDWPTRNPKFLKEIQDFSNKYIGNLGLVQISHHGSCDDYHPAVSFYNQFDNKNINTFVCSKKYGNFPCPCVHKLKFLQHVTDNPQSQLDFEILI